MNAVPRGRLQRSHLWRLLDERDPAGGRLKAALMLTHPGPSMLVAATAVAVTGLAMRSVPAAGLALRVGLLMLFAQLSIGITNDLADLAADRISKAYKPLVRRAVDRRGAAAAAALLAVAALTLGASLGGAALGATALGLGAGIAYDLGLKHSVVAVLAWWAGFSALPLLAFAAASRLRPDLWWEVPLAGMLALLLLCANALPDIEGDRAAGTRSLPVHLGEPATRRLALATGAALGGSVATLAAALGQGPTTVAAAALVAAVAVVSLGLPGEGGRHLALRSFVPLSLSGALLAATWLATLPG